MLPFLYFKVDEKKIRYFHHTISISKGLPIASGINGQAPRKFAGVKDLYIDDFGVAKSNDPEVITAIYSKPKIRQIFYKPGTTEVNDITEEMVKKSIFGILPKKASKDEREEAEAKVEQQLKLIAIHKKQKDYDYSLPVGLGLQEAANRRDKAILTAENEALKNEALKLENDQLKKANAALKKKNNGPPKDKENV